MKTAFTREELAARGIEAVVIGGSAGGVDALLALLPGLPADLPLPVMVVLHIPPHRDSRLAELFQNRAAYQVREAQDKEPVAAGAVYFAAAGYHLSVERDRSFSLSLEAPVHFARPAIDVLMESAADVYGSAVAGLLLTGANHDGAQGLAAIGAAGGLTVVQDPAEAPVPTMPAYAIGVRAPDYVLPLADIRALLMMLETR